MQVRTEGLRVGLAVAAVLFAGASGVQAQQPAEAPAAPACTITLDPGMLKPQAEAFQVKATLSQPIGDAMGAEIQEPNSGINVSIVPAADAAAAHPAAKKTAAKKPAAAAQAAPAADASAASGQVVNLKLATGTAKAGDYTLALKSASRSCTGKFHLGDEAPAKTGP